MNTLLLMICGKIKNFIKHRFLLVGALICLIMFVLANIGTGISTIVSKWKNGLEQSAVVRVFTSEDGMYVDISAVKVKDFLGQPRRTLEYLLDSYGTLSAKLKNETVHETAESVKSDGIRLADQLKGISGEDVKNAATGVAYSYFKFWDRLADNADTDLSPVMDGLGKEPSIGNGYLSEYFPLMEHSGTSADSEGVPYLNEQDALELESPAESDSTEADAIEVMEDQDGSVQQDITESVTEAEEAVQEDSMPENSPE